MKKKVTREESLVNGGKLNEVVKRLVEDRGIGVTHCGGGFHIYAKQGIAKDSEYRIMYVREVKNGNYRIRPYYDRHNRDANLYVYLMTILAVRYMGKFKIVDLIDKVIPVIEMSKEDFEAIMYDAISIIVDKVEEMDGYGTAV